MVNDLYPSFNRLNIFLYDQASSESHKAQRVLHEQRRASKLNSKLLMDSKRIWSLARKKNMQSSERRTHIRSLMDIIRGKVKDIVFKHDASRIVQTVVKYGGEKERNDVAVELKGSYKDLAQSKYSKVEIFSFSFPHFFSYMLLVFLSFLS